MKKLKLFPKTFLYTLCLMFVIILISHLLIYLLLPVVYNYHQKANLEKEVTVLLQNITEGKESDRLALVTDFASKWCANITVDYDGYSYEMNLLGDLSDTTHDSQGGLVDATIIAERRGNDIKISLAENLQGGADFFHIQESFADNLTVGSKLFLSAYSANDTETKVGLEIVALYASDPSMEFDDDTVFLTHDAYWKLTNTSPQTYSGKVSFIVNDPLELDNVIEQIKQLDGINWDNYIFSKNNESYEAISYQLSTLERLTAILISVSAIICAAILFLVLAMRVRNRVHEAGIMLAVGISKSNIIIQYMAEVSVLLALAFIVSYFASTSITAGIAAYLQKLIGIVDITIAPCSLLLQYFCEAAVTGIAVIVASTPIIHLKPKDILSKID